MTALARLTASFALLFSLITSTQAAFQYLPAPTTYVTDMAHVLRPSEKEKLERRLQSFQRRSGLQSVILIVPSLQGDVLEDVAAEQFKRWGIGSKRENNGLLLFIAVEDRAIRIEVGYGLEGQLTDAESGRIIREDLVPLLRQQRFYDALMAYELRTEVIFRVAPAEGQDRGGYAGAHRRSSPISTLLFVLIVFLFMGAKMLQHLFFPQSRWRNLSSRGGLNSWGGGFGGGGFGGGGFSGGGGLSGGGGASGRW